MRDVEARERSQGQRADRNALAEITDLVDQGDYDTAGVIAWEVQRRTPGDPAIWLLLTRIDYLRERYAAAMYAARMATRLDPASAQAWLWLARTGATRSRWRTEGLDAALQATALAPGDPQTWTALAQLHLARDARYEAAIAAERAVRVGPNDVEAHRTLGLIALRAEEWRHAVAAFRRALELDPADVEARAGLIQGLEALGIDPANELEHYGPVVRRPPTLGERVRRVASENAARTDVGPLPSQRRQLLIGIVAAVIVGAVLGLAIPGLGVVRGLAGAGALVLMWVAIWPLRLRPRQPTARNEAGDRAAEAVQQPMTRADAQDSRPAQAAAPKRPPAPERSAKPERPVKSERPAKPARPAAVQRPVAARTSEPPRRAGAKPSLRPSAQLPAPDQSDKPPPQPAEQPAAKQPIKEDKKPVERPRRLKRPPQDERAEQEVAQANSPAPRPTGQQARRLEPSLTAAAVRKAAREQPSEQPDPRPAEQPPVQPAPADDLPDDPAELVALSQTRLAEFDLEAARAAATRLADVAPGSLEAHRALAAVSLAEQDYPQAELHYGKVLEIEPLDQDAIERLAMAKKGRRREQEPQRRRRKG